MSFPTIWRTPTASLPPHRPIGHSSGKTKCAAGVISVPVRLARPILCPFQKGDKVDLSAWDLYERPDKRLGRSVVISGYKSQCQSGWMIWIKSLEYPHLSERDLDSHWLTLIP